MHTRAWRQRCDAALWCVSGRSQGVRRGAWRRRGSFSNGRTRQPVRQTPPPSGRHAFANARAALRRTGRSARFTMSHSRWQRHQLMRCIAPFASLAALPVVRAAGSQHLAEYPNTFYAHSLNLDRPPRPALDRHVPNVSHSALTARRRDIETDVCVVGGGFAGLAAALGLVERGKRVRPSLARA